MAKLTTDNRQLTTDNRIHKNKLMKKLLIFSLLITLVSCYKDPEITGQFSDEFYVRHQGIDMPVWVRGNEQSEVFIIFIHGGPLLSGIEVAIGDDFSRLHENYAIVYYDQRGGGFSHGENRKNLNEAQLIEDLDTVVDFIQSEYDKAKSIFLMGHSWGGYLGTAYLTDPIREAKIQGWIELAGAHNNQLNHLASKDYVLNYAQQQISSNTGDVAFWQEITEKLNKITVVDTYDKVREINFPAQVIENIYNANSPIPRPSNYDWLISPAGISIEQKDRFDLEAVVVSGNLNPKMGNITLPTLLLYGELDAIVPKVSAQNAYDFLGTSEEDKRIVILENGAHDMWLLEMERFVAEVERFVEQYR